MFGRYWCSSLVYFWKFCKNLETQTNIYLSQRRNPDWYLGLDYLKDGLKKDGCNGVGNSFKSLEFLNAWEVSKSEIIEYVRNCYKQELRDEWYPKQSANWGYNYKYYLQNPDGSIDVTFTIYFRPQLYYYFWILVSCGFFLVIFLSLISISLTKYRENRKSDHHETF